jgi:DNA-directed RNA polymerase specialized sigma24 family protein
VPRPERAFETAYVGLFVRAERTARRVLADPGVAEDVAAETMTRAFVSWGRIEPYAEAWVTRVTINLALDSLRRKRHLAIKQGGRSVEDRVLDSN